MVDHLEGDLGAMAVHPLREFLESGEIFIARDGELSLCGCTVWIGDGGHFGNDESDPAASPLLVVRNERLPRVPVGLGDLDAHGAHRDSVAQFYSAEGRR